MFDVLQRTAETFCKKVTKLVLNNLAEQYIKTVRDKTHTREVKDKFYANVRALLPEESASKYIDETNVTVLKIG